MQIIRSHKPAKLAPPFRPLKGGGEGKPVTSPRALKRAVVLLSGGIDSTTTLAIAIAEGYKAYALSFDYGQRHQIETQAARRVAKSLGAKEHRIENRPARLRRLGAHGRDRCAEATFANRNRARHPRHVRSRAQHNLSRVLL